MRTLDDGVCDTAVPAPHRFPRMADFFAENPISTPTGNRKIQRVFVPASATDGA